MISFFVGGVPIPKGSAKAFVVKAKKTGKLRAVVTQDNSERQKPWASIISVTAQEKGVPLFQGGVELRITFHMPRPKGHYGTGKNATVLKLDAPRWPTGTPDLDKLVRLVGDSLTGIAWKDDSQIVVTKAAKIYSETPGAVITIAAAMI